MTKFTDYIEYIYIFVFNISIKVHSKLTTACRRSIDTDYQYSSHKDISFNLFEIEIQNPSQSSVNIFLAKQRNMLVIIHRQFNSFVHCISRMKWCMLKHN